MFRTFSGSLYFRMTANKSPNEKLAVLDLGSNSLRMSIFDLSGPGTAPQTFRKTIRLSEGMTHDSTLKAEPQMRAVHALLEYKKILDSNGVSNIVAVATAAVRKAKNQTEFLDLVRDTTGIEIKVIDGTTEAALDSLAISRTLGLGIGTICDIGGGSTELVGIGKTPPAMVSIPHGSRGICEMFFGLGETQGAVREARAFAKNLLATVDWLDGQKGAPLVGIGGTIRALAIFDLKENAPTPIGKYEFSPDRLKEIFDEVLSKDPSARALMPGIGQERADIILGGVILLEAVINRLSPEKIVVCDAGVREGVFFDFVENLGILKANE